MRANVHKSKRTYNGKVGLHNSLKTWSTSKSDYCLHIHPTSRTIFDYALTRSRTKTSGFNLKIIIPFFKTEECRIILLVYFNLMLYSGTTLRFNKRHIHQEAISDKKLTIPTKLRLEQKIIIINKTTYSKIWYPFHDASTINGLLKLVLAKPSVTHTGHGACANAVIIIIIIINLTSMFFQDQSRAWTAASQQHKVDNWHVFDFYGLWLELGTKNLTIYSKLGYFIF